MKIILPFLKKITSNLKVKIQILHSPLIFGTFTKVKRKARTGVNPSTGEKIKIKAKTLPKFRPGKDWKEML